MTVAYDYFLAISINYKNNFMTATFDENVMDHECIEEIKTLFDTFMEKPYMQEIYIRWIKKKRHYYMRWELKMISKH